MILDDIVAKRREQLDREMRSVSLEEVMTMAEAGVGFALEVKANPDLKIKHTANCFYNAINSNRISQIVRTEHSSKLGRPRRSIYGQPEHSSKLGQPEHSSKLGKPERFAVIAEVKKASPSKGIIRADFDPVEIAITYEKYGANAISVLTEEYYFKGSSEYIKQIRQAVNIPILRKDFIIDEYQIYEAKAIGADAILLIVAILNAKIMKEFLTLAESLELDCLVEVHDEKELKIAISSGAKIIGINNRNLKTFEVSLETTKRLVSLIPEGCIIVSESGIVTNNDMKDLKACGVNAVLVGETLMRSEDVGETLNSLRSGI